MGHESEIKVLVLLLKQCCSFSSQYCPILAFMPSCFEAHGPSYKMRQTLHEMACTRVNTDA